MMQRNSALAAGVTNLRAMFGPAKWFRRRPGFAAASVRENVRYAQPNDARVELALAGFALISIVAAQMLLTSAIHGASYRGPDGGMVQSVVLTALRFGDFFSVTNINPLQAIGSQILPKNAWANPAFWPFAFFDREVAADLSPIVALACFAIASYIMARCFDLPVLPSVLAAQLCIVLFAPIVYFYDTPRNFAATPADAVTYAPYMVALGLLARLQAGSWRRFVVVTAAITACILFSIYCDPGLWID